MIPAGTVTLLLGEAGGLVQMWETDRAGASEASRRLNALVDEEAKANSGSRPLDQGDGENFLLVFSRAYDAVACA
ncbi:MAG: ATP-binding protein, partial [Acidimicrobiia bacterium]